MRSILLGGLGAAGLLVFTALRGYAGDDAKAPAARTVASWIDQLGSVDAAQAREAEQSLVGLLKTDADSPRNDAKEEDVRAFRVALETTDGVRQQRLLGVLATLVRGGNLDEYGPAWDDLDPTALAHAWGRHGVAALEPLMDILRQGGNDIRTPLGETVALALAEVGDPAIAPLLGVLMTAPSPIPPREAPNRDALVEAASAGFGARSRAAYALARIPHARERAVAPMIAHLLERDPFDEFVAGAGDPAELDPDLSRPGLSYRAFAGMGEMAIPPLLAALARERAPQKRARVLAALRSLESAAAAAVPAVAALIDDPKEDPRVRKTAVGVLGYVRTEAGVDSLLRALSVEADGVGREAHFSLYLIGRPAVPALRRMLASKEPDALREAAELLAGYGAASEEALPYFLAHWDDLGVDRWDAIRFAAGEIAGSIGIAPEDLVKRCVVALASREPDVRSGALSALIRIAPGAGLAAPDVARLADSDPDAAVRTVAVMAIAAIDPSRLKAAHLPLLVEELGQQMAHRRAGAAQAIARVPPPLAPALVALMIDVLGSWEEYTYFEALRALADLGPAAEAAIPLLEEIEADAARPPRRGTSMGSVLATHALWKILPDGVDRAVKEIEALPGKRQFSVRDDYMLEALREMGPRGAKAVPALLRALAESSDAGAAHIAESLGGIGTSPEKVVPALLARLDSHDAFVRAGAATGLGGYAAAAKSAVPRLIAAIGDPTPEVRSAAADALGRIGLDAPRVVPALATALRDPSENVRREAAYALGLYGAAASGAVPALESIRLDREVPVQRTVVRALRAIRSSMAGERAPPPAREPTLRTPHRRR